MAAIIHLNDFKAIIHVNDSGFTHSDLHPGNIKITYDATPDLTKIESPSEAFARVPKDAVRLFDFGCSIPKSHNGFEDQRMRDVINATLCAMLLFTGRKLEDITGGQEPRAEGKFISCLAGQLSVFHRSNQHGYLINFARNQSSQLL